MIHRKARSLMTPAEVGGLRGGDRTHADGGAADGPSGSISVPNSDGTRTVIGAVNATGPDIPPTSATPRRPGCPRASRRGLVMGRCTSRGRYLAQAVSQPISTT